MSKKSNITRREAIGTLSAALATPLLPKGELGMPRADADYSLQQRITGLQVPDTITVIGCGGFGAWPAFFSALCGVKKMVVFDPAEIDALDLARTPYPASYVGKPKVSALKDLVLHVRPNVQVETYHQIFTAKDLPKIQGPTVFDGTNDSELGKLLSSAAEKGKFKYVTGFYGKDHVGVMSSYSGKPVYESGKNVPVWIGTSSLSGLFAMSSAFHQPFSFVGPVVGIGMSKEQVDSGITTMGECGK